jgi:uncharacterized protein DUF6894
MDAAIPRFYFDVLEDGVSAADEHGVLVDRLADAEHEAAVVLAETLSVSALRASRHDLQILIRDKERNALSRLRLTFSRDHLA